MTAPTGETAHEDWRPLLRAVADRIIPRDAWPSASEAGGPVWWQRHQMWEPDVWQDLLVPGLKALEREALARTGRVFDALDDAAQDAVLVEVAMGRVLGWPVPAATFWARLLDVVADGYYGSPANGGNEGARSWKMVGFRPEPLPGHPIVRQTPPRLTPLHEVADTYDVVVVGAGAGGLTAAAILAESGRRVLVLERGHWLDYDAVGQDHAANHRLSRYGHNTGPSPSGFPRTMLRPDGQERLTRPHEAAYHNNAMTVGGGTRVFGAQAWRFHPDDFRMASRYGVPEGSGLADWPITYDDLGPYYDEAEWALGVSGAERAHPGRGDRGRPYPMPPLPATQLGRRLTEAAERLGWEPGPVPLLINSVPYDGRPACGRCGQCVGFACPTNSKNGTHNTMLGRALATGRTALATETLVARVETTGSVAVGVHAWSRGAGEDGPIARRFIRAGHVVVAAGAVESARLLLHSATGVEPDGVGNRMGLVGRFLQGHVYSGASGLFDEPVEDGLGPGVSVATCRFAHGNPAVVGGGMLANDFTRLPLVHWHRTWPPHAPRWGTTGKAAMRETYRRTGEVKGPVQEIPMASARVQLSKTVRDAFGLPVALLSGGVHPESLRAARFLRERAEEWLSEAGARRVWAFDAGPGLSAGQHQAGTLRMGADPAVSVTDPWGRVHGYRNLWVMDGSVHVTNGGVNPVLTIVALALRASHHLASGN